MVASLVVGLWFEVGFSVVFVATCRLRFELGYWCAGLVWVGLWVLGGCCFLDF